MARVKEFNEAAVLDKALELFWHKGYNGTSAQDLVTGLGISRSSLYDTFGDKRTLFIKALRLYQQKNTDAMLQLARESTDALATVTQIFENLLQEGVQDTLTKGCFVVNTAVELSSHDAEIKEIVNENMKTAEEAFLITLKKGQASGQLSSSLDIKSTARFLLNNVFGLRVAFRAGHSKKVIQDVIKVALSVLN